MIVIVYSFGFPNFKFDYYIEISKPLYFKVFLNSFILAGITTISCFLLAYPLAYYIALRAQKWKNLLLILLILPFWMSLLLRTYAIMNILNTFGLMFTFTAVVIGMVYDYLPFMVLPLYASLEKLKKSQIEASYVLGANPWKTFFKITLPQSKSGIIAGVILVFIPSLGEFVVPAMLGGTYVTIGTITWDLFLRYHDWWRGSALSMLYMAIIFIALAFYMRKEGKIEI
ncbi:MAG: ABC transporter permease [Archaeoglobaceae archaeon]|nr:ABC transporter permease [Archaeoglobaceae archaeon]